MLAASRDVDRGAVTMPTGIGQLGWLWSHAAVWRHGAAGERRPRRSVVTVAPGYRRARTRQER